MGLYKYVGTRKINICGTQYRHGEIIRIEKDLFNRLEPNKFVPYNNQLNISEKDKKEEKTKEMKEVSENKTKKGGINYDKNLETKGNNSTDSRRW